MPKWLKKCWRVADNAVQRTAAWFALLLALGIFSAAVAVVNQVTQSISALAAYGWGLPVLVAIGIVLAILVVLSLTAIAWRYFRPLPPPLPMLPSMETAAEIEPSPDIGRLERRMDLLERSLPPLERQSEEFASKIGEIERAITEIDVKLQTSLKTLAERFSTHEQVVASGARLLIRALRAHDAMRDVLLPNDQTVMSLGKRLMYPESYPNAAAWLTDYRGWSAALRAIDNLMIEWTRGQHPTAYVSMFDLKEHHYKTAPMPPDNIRSDDTIIEFKTVCQVQSSYANRRDGIFSFFNEKAVYPGS